MNIATLGNTEMQFNAICTHNETALPPKQSSFYSILFFDKFQFFNSIRYKKTSVEIVEFPHGMVISVFAQFYIILPQQLSFFACYTGLSALPVGKHPSFMR